jgi:hypothetical protein
VLFKHDQIDTPSKNYAGPGTISVPGPVSLMSSFPGK